MSWSCIGLDTIALGLCGLVLWIQEAPLVVDCVSLISACISFAFGGLSLDFLWLDPLHSLLLVCAPCVGVDAAFSEYLLLKPAPV